MPPAVALFLWLMLTLALLWFDPAKEPGTSLTLWVPVIWMFIVASRLPSQWPGGEVGLASEALEEGNSLDRSVFLVLILLAVFILSSRSFRWRDLVAGNLALMGFLSFALVSVLWSDFPFVAFKRWFRDLGNYLLILVAFTDPRPLEALQTLLRRLSYLLIPLSLVLAKYYPGIGMGYNPWTGTAMYSGAATGKNGLGAICLVSGLFFFWDTVTRWPNRAESRTRRIILVNLVFLAMTLRLLYLADSATSRLCLLIGCLVILVALSKTGQRNPRGLTIAIPAFLFLNLVLVFGFGFDIKGLVAEASGRNPTLTDRTLIWNILLDAHTNPLIGTGYESFWLGPRLSWVWQHKETAGLGEAHDGYLEVYLNLGIIGLFLLVAFLIASYRTICARLRDGSPGVSLALALWTVVLFYNITEAAFKWHVIWVTFLLGAIAVPRYSEGTLHIVAAFDDAAVTEPLAELPNGDS